MTDYESIARNVDSKIRDRLGNAYEVFYDDYSEAFYVSAPRDADESDSTECPTCALIMGADESVTEEELYANALVASEETDRLIAALREDGEW